MVVESDANLGGLDTIVLPIRMLLRYKMFQSSNIDVIV